MTTDHRTKYMRYRVWLACSATMKATRNLISGEKGQLRFPGSGADLGRAIGWLLENGWIESHRTTQGRKRDIKVWYMRAPGREMEQVKEAETKNTDDHGDKVTCFICGRLCITNRKPSVCSATCRESPRMKRLDKARRIISKLKYKNSPRPYDFDFVRRQAIADVLGEKEYYKQAKQC